MRSTLSKQLAVGGGVLLLFGLAVYASTFLSQSDTLTSFVAWGGYGAVFVSGVIAGLNVLLPVPAATLTPVFTTAGLDLAGIVVALALGTLAADCLGYVLGHTTKPLLDNHHPRFTAFLETLATKSRRWIVLVVFGYATFAPLPNELILIPLALAGVPLRYLLPVLIAGALLNQTLLVYGADSVARLLLS